MTSTRQHETSGIPRLSLRLRLTLWVIAVFAIVQVSVSVILSLYQEASIDEFFDDRLTARAVASVERLRDSVPGITGERLDAETRSEARLVLFQNFYLAIYGRDATFITASAAEFPIERNLIEQALEQPSASVIGTEVDLGSEGIQQDRDTRIALVPFRGSDGELYLLLAATGDTYAQRMIALVWSNMLIAIVIGLAAAAVSGWFIAGIAVAPFSRLRRFAQHLSPESIGEEVDVDARSTEVASLQVDLEAARERLARGYAAQERFMANVSHELKTPVSVLMAEAETLPLKPQDEPTRQFVNSVRDEMWRLGRMIDSFLLLTRVRDGSGVVNMQSFLVNELVIDSIEHCAPMAAQYGVRLTAQLMEDEDDLDVRVNGDPALLRTMLDNLVRNAIRFSPAGETVRIEVQRDEQRILLRVIDRGCGIPDHLIDHVFDRFALLPADERRGRGQGLGLEIAQGIAELHGGFISVRNTDAGGCEFTVSLPLGERGDLGPNRRDQIGRRFARRDAPSVQPRQRPAAPGSNSR